MPTPIATLIVPVYNTARWLQEALDSIEQQECRSDLEVIIVDDGSTDRSADICLAYAESASAVRYVRQENSGLGAARNHGVRLSTGRYLAFLDSDDLYPPRALSTLIETAEAEQADIVVGDLHGFPARPSPIWRREIILGPRVITSLDYAPDIVGNPSACNKVFRRDLVERYQARFSEGTAFEDVLFTLPLMLRADRIALIPDLVYLYRRRGDGSSIMDNRDQPKRILEHLDVVERLATECSEAGEGSQYAIRRWIAYMQLSYAWRAVKFLDDQQLTDFTKRMFALFREIPLDATAEYVTALDIGLRAVALYEENEATFRAPRWCAPLRVFGGQVYVGHPSLSRFRDLLRAHPFLVTFELRPGDRSPDNVFVTGTCFLAGVSVEPGDVRPDLVLEVGDGVVRRPITVTKKANNQFEWVCDVPLTGIDAGRHALRLVVRDRGAEITVSVKAPPDNQIGAVVNSGQAQIWVELASNTAYLIVTSDEEGAQPLPRQVRQPRLVSYVRRTYRALRRRARPAKRLLLRLGLNRLGRR